MKPQAWFGVCVALRCMLAVCLRTSFNPDEYWQSVEVAHDMVFGYGWRTWEWQAAAMIRGYLHPLLFALPFLLLRVTGLDSPAAVVYLPKLVQGVVAAASDMGTYYVGCRLFGPGVGKTALLFSLLSWFTGFTMVRTFSSSVEACLTMWSLVWWPLPWETLPRLKYSGVLDVAGRGVGRLRLSLHLAALCVVFRPTSAVLFLPLGAGLLLHHAGKREWSRVAVLLREAVCAGVLWLLVGAAVDRVGYGQWTLVPWNFFRLNSVQGVSVLYGTHPWWWYFGEGLPVVALAFLPLFVLGAYRSRVRTPWLLVLWSCLVFSANAHKEYRFLLPVLPLVLVCAALGMQHITWRRSTWTVLVLANVIMLAYFGGMHQAGPLALMAYLRRVLPRQSSPPPHVLFLMPCHATPLHSHVHLPGATLEFLDCSPRIVDGRLTRRGTEDDRFHTDPLALAREKLGKGPLPSHVALFTGGEDDDGGLLLRWLVDDVGYSEQRRFPHTPDLLHSEPDQVLLLATRGTAV